MNHAVHNKLVSFIWSIADDCLRDIYVRFKVRLWDYWGDIFEADPAPRPSGGESNIRRRIIENDLLEAVIQLPNNLFYNTFYNTGITT